MDEYVQTRCTHTLRDTYRWLTPNPQNLAAGIEPTVIEYLKNPPSREQLSTMIADAGLTAREAIREKGTPYAELGLNNRS